jgi:hypothetical protein
MARHCPYRVAFVWAPKAPSDPHRGRRQSPLGAEEATIADSVEDASHRSAVTKGRVLVHHIGGILLLSAAPRSPEERLLEPQSVALTPSDLDTIGEQIVHFCTLMETWPRLVVCNRAVRDAP